MQQEQLIDELTLALIHLTSWDEKAFDGTVRRAWKSYDWDALDRLEEQELITFSRKAKSLYLTKKGEKLAEALAASYEIAMEAFSDVMQETMAAMQPVSDAPAFRFRVTLDLGTAEECWREIVVPQDWAFADLHETIQSCFLWWGYHMYDFKLRSHGQQLEILDPDHGGIDGMFAWRDQRYTQMDATKLLLSDVFPRTRTATYSYDYGDGWVHHVKFVETIPLFQGEMPTCTAGAGDAPPEDVGSTSGFAEFKRIMADPAGPEYEDTRAWAEGLFWEPFDLTKVNERMHKWRTGEIFDEWDERNGS